LYDVLQEKEQYTWTQKELDEVYNELALTEATFSSIKLNSALKRGPTVNKWKLQTLLRERASLQACESGLSFEFWTSGYFFFEEGKRVLVFFGGWFVYLTSLIFL